MKNKITVEISEGLGNQLFMYSHAYALAKKINYDLYIDSTSGYSRKKNTLRKHQQFMLDSFNIKTGYADSSLRFDTPIKHIFKKILIFLDNFNSNKKFIVEKNTKIDGRKKAEYIIHNIKELSDSVYVQGNFENYKYFEFCRDELINILSIKSNLLNFNLPIINKLKDTNSISIHIRANRYSDQINLTDNKENFEKSKLFTNQIIDYLNNGIDFFKKKISTPKFFIWSNDFTNIEETLKNIKTDQYELVNTNNVISDFHLFKYSKNFIVGPSSFHWWGAWLNENSDKICVRPSNLSPSNNDHFWPDDWIKI